jgi:hypothetical protein
MPDQALMNYFKFDESDLQANRNGEISEKQKERVSKKAKSRLFANPFSKFGYKLGKVQGPIKFKDVQTAYHGGELWTYLDI